MLPPTEFQSLADQIGQAIARELAEQIRTGGCIPVAKEFLTPAEASSFTGYPVRQLEKLRATGQGPRYSRPGDGRAIRYALADLRAWMEAGRVADGRG